MFTLVSFTVTLLCIFLFFPSVEGHGYVATVTIGGKVYPGWDPNVDPYVRIESSLVSGSDLIVTDMQTLSRVG